MKFTALTKAFSADAIEEGVWLQLLGPDDEPMFLKPNADDPTLSQFPCRFRVRSVLSKAFDAAQDEQAKMAANRARRLKGAQQRNAVMEELKKERPKNFSVLVTEVENIDTDKPGESGKPSRSELLAFAEDPNNRFWVDQVLDFAADNRNYGGKAEDQDPTGKPSADAA